MDSERGNYTSYQENMAEADAQLRKELGAGYLRWAATREELEKDLGELVLSRVGVIVSTKDGRRKLRLIHDLRRSLVNSKVILEERLVLPRLSDLVDDVLDLLESCKKGESVTLFSGDFRDAFKQLHVGLAEQRFLSGRAMEGFFAYSTVLFGVGSGPLVWGRVAAGTMRVSQGAAIAETTRLQCFVDDPMAAIKGTKAEQDAIVCFC